MPPIYDMNDDMMLHALIQGELNDADQQDVFARLTRDAQLQRRYRELVLLQSALQEDARSLSVPPAYTAAVFSAIGLSIPDVAASNSAASGHAAAAHTAATVGGPVSTALWWTAGRIAAMVGVLATAVVLVFLWRVPSSPPPAGGSTRQQSRAAAQLPSATALPQTDSSAETSAHAASHAGRSLSHPLVFHTAPPASPSRESTETENTHGAPPGSDRIDDGRTGLPASMDVLPAADAAAAQTDAEAQVSHKDSSSRAEIDAAHTLTRPRSDATFLRGVVLMLRYSAAASSPAVNVASKSPTALRDIAFAAGYRMSSSNRAGVEIGREAFAQRFGMSEADGYARYQQNPLEFWLSAFYERTHISLFSGTLDVFTRLNTGAVFELGPMIRGSVGVRIPVTGTINAYAAGEGVIVVYRHGSLWLTSKKYGPTAGIAVEF